MNQVTTNVCDQLKQIKLPPQDIDLLTFCLSNKAAKLAAWVDTLKLTQTEQASVLLYQSVPQVLRLKCKATTRFEMLEALRPAVQNCIGSLTKEFLNQPLMLPEQTQKKAIIAQALQRQMIDGYCLCIRDWVNRGKVKASLKETYTTAIHRAFTGMSLLSLRSYQLYSSIPSGLWTKAHTLYKLAQSTEILNTRVSDTLNTHSLSKVETAYIRLLGMACSRLYQVTPAEAEACHTALEQWSQHISLVALAELPTDNIVFIDLNCDRGPLTHKNKPKKASHELLKLNLDVLCQQLKHFNSQQDQYLSHSDSGASKGVSTNLLLHLQDSWSLSTARNNERQSLDIPAHISIGLFNCHQILSGNLSFDAFINEAEEANSYESLKSNLLNSMKEPTAQADSPLCRATIQNEGNNGCCLRITDAKGNKAEAGELVIVRQAGRRHWKLGIIRWLRKLKDHSLIGVQILSSQAQPYGVSMFFDTGGYGDYTCGFYLPASNSQTQLASLITPAAPFKELAKVRLKNSQTELKGLLGRNLMTSVKVAQFEVDPAKLEPIPAPRAS